MDAYFARVDSSQSAIHQHIIMHGSFFSGIPWYSFGSVGMLSTIWAPTPSK